MPPISLIALVAQAQAPNSKWRATIPAAVSGLVLLLATAPAEAAFPGTNGSIAFSAMGGWESSNLFVNAGDGSESVQLTDDWWDDSGPAFSPDGSQIAFTSDRDGDQEIYVMRPDGTGLARVTENPAQDFSPAYSADGSRIVFVSDRDGNQELYSVRADGSGEARITSSAADEQSPARSADGTRVAYVSDRDGKRDIYVGRTDGSDAVRILNPASRRTGAGSRSPARARAECGTSTSCRPTGRRRRCSPATRAAPITARASLRTVAWSSSPASPSVRPAWPVGRSSAAPSCRSPATALAPAERCRPTR
jgi:hypothetical protein